MSINIKKNLYINTIDYLYKLIRSNDELTNKDYKFSIFHDYMYEYYNGCNCSQEQFFNLAKNEFEEISKSDDCISILKEHFECDDVIFIK